MKMAELDLSKVPTILLLLQAWRAFSLYKREPIKQSASLHSSAPGSFHRHNPSSTYIVCTCMFLAGGDHYDHTCVLFDDGDHDDGDHNAHTCVLHDDMMTIHMCPLMMVTTHSVSRSGQGVS